MSLSAPLAEDTAGDLNTAIKKRIYATRSLEKGAVTVTIQIGDKAVPALEAHLEKMMPKTRVLWNNRYPCENTGGWVHYRILNDDELKDVSELIKIKKKPIAGR